jgi:hypothetical protein
MAYDYDADANRNSCFAQYDPPDREEPEDFTEIVRCPVHGHQKIVDYDSEHNLLDLECGCLV